MAEESSRAWKDQYMLRLPDGMRDRIKAAAEANNRSMNAEIVATLYDKYPQEIDPDLDDLVRKALAFAPEEVERFLLEFVDRAIASGKISGREIEDGLIPGLKKAN